MTPSQLDIDSPSYHFPTGKLRCARCGEFRNHHNHDKTDGGALLPGAHLFHGDGTR